MHLHEPLNSRLVKVCTPVTSEKCHEAHRWCRYYQAVSPAWLDQEWRWKSWPACGIETEDGLPAYLPESRRRYEERMETRIRQVGWHMVGIQHRYREHPTDQTVQPRPGSVKQTASASSAATASAILIKSSPSLRRDGCYLAHQQSLSRCTTHVGFRIHTNPRYYGDL